MEAATYSLRMKMVEDLISCLDVDTGELSVHGRKLHMTHAHAGYLLGLPSRGRDVDGLISQADAHENFGIARTSLTPNALYAELILMPDGEDFKWRLLLYIVGTIIRPTGNVHISTSYLSLLHRLDEIKDMNWAKFAFEGVLAALFYLEHLAIGIIHQLIIERETPRFSFWTDARITRAVKHVIHRGGVRAHTVDMFTPSDHTARVEGQDVNDLKSQIDALQREVIILKSHVTLSLVDVRREMSDMMLEDFIARADNGTKSGVGAPEDTQKKEANDALEDPVKVAVSPVVISSTNIDSEAAPVDELGLTQDMQVLQVPQATQRKKETEPQMRVISPSIDSSVNYPLQQSLVASRRDTLRSADQRILGAKKRSPYVRYPRKGKAKQVKIADATVEIDGYMGELSLSFPHRFLTSSRVR
ncbi:hypothetical protein J5N97_003853 [Dioscorea zingiberensis]|uniref:Uncharacterized protein n=1 Tax=Dioscorea zingiberensis TaxID=325984 RepID=A0A9D5D6W2_9LILI|nr:hypothetical protein J5N97_003853 [Dioscorea zingiberensis]